MKLNLRGAIRKQARQASEARALVCGFFGSTSTTDLWMRSENPLLGGLRPVEMIRLGRGDRLIKFIKNSLEENKRP